MVCSFCHQPVPRDALFCGSCGSAVAPSPWNVAQPRLYFGRRPAMPVLRAGADDPAASTAEEICLQCASVLAVGEVFCGACGFISRLAARESSSIFALTTPRALATSLIPPPPLGGPTTDLWPVDARFAQVQQANLPRSEKVSAEPEIERPEDSLDSGDLEVTRIVQSRATDAQRYVLQFSTGESVTVFGSGLVGRNPQAEPGESFDTTVWVIDPTRSVSKTHLEFGQTGGRFWVNDRFSGNGSIVREPDAAPARCSPGRRQLVARGSRIDMGEQFFVVS